MIDNTHFTMTTSLCRTPTTASSTGHVCAIYHTANIRCFFDRATLHSAVLVSHRKSGRLSVCHTRELCPHGLAYDHDFFVI